MKFTKWFFILSLIFFPLGEIIRIPVIKDIVVKPVDLFVVLTTFSLVFQFRKIKKNILWWPFIIFVGTAILSLLVNAQSLSIVQLLVALSYLIRWVGYAGIFFAVSLFDTVFRKKILWFLVIDAFVVLVLGFVQYIFYPDLRNLYYLGWDEHLYRLFSVFLDPNFAASFLTLFFIFLLSARNFVGKFRNNILFIISLSVVLIGIILTYSRSGILMFAISVGLFFLFQKKIKILSFLFLIMLLGILVSTRVQVSEGTNLLRTASSFSRIDSMEEAIVIIKESPLFGVGFNAYKYALQKQNIEKPTKAQEQHANTSTDTSLLFVLATSGVVGLLSYLYFYTNLLVFSYREYKKGSMLALGLFVSLIGLLINSIFINSLFYPFIMLWVFAYTGLIAKE